MIRCLVFGRTEERVARVQESYIAQANATWMESLDRSMTQMKEYQVSTTQFIWEFGY